MKKLTLGNIVEALPLLLILFAVYTLMFMLFSVLLKSSVLGHVVTICLLAVTIGWEILSNRSLQLEMQRIFPDVARSQKIEITDDDLKFALASVCDSQEEANMRLEKKIFGGLVMQLAEEHAHLRREGGSITQTQGACDIPSSGAELLQTTTMINTIASGS